MESSNFVKPGWMRSGNACLYLGKRTEIHSIQSHVTECVEYVDSVSILMDGGTKSVSPYDLSEMVK